MEGTIKSSGKKDGFKRNRVNEEIEVAEVRLIDAQGGQVGIVTIQAALEVAIQAGLDLVEIAPESEPPVCRLMNFGKFLFDEKKKRAESKRKQKQIQIKEIKFRPSTEEGDYQVKLRSLRRFLEDGDKAKVTLRFKGREMASPLLGAGLFERIAADLADVGVVEQEVKSEGRQMVMVFSPKKRH